jgi:hypothetical protein
MNSLQLLLHRLGLNGRHQPLLPPPRDPVVGVNGHNEDTSTAWLFGGLRVLPSKVVDGDKIQATFVGKSGANSVLVFTDGSTLSPYPFDAGNGKVVEVPALFKLPEMGCYDLRLVLTCHPLMFGRFFGNLSRLTEGANDYRRSFLDAIKRWAVGNDDSSIHIARTLWLFVPPNFAPRFSGVFGGKVLNSSNAGSGLHSLVYGLPPKLNYISHDPMTGDACHLDYASPRSVVFVDDQVVIDNQWSFYFWDGGQLSSKNFAELLKLPVDIFLRLEFQRGTPFLFVTPLLRLKVRKGDSQSVLSMSGKLLEISNWKLVTGADLEIAWRAFFPGGPNLPGRFGRHSVRGWTSVSPSGILQQVAEAIIPVGDPNGSLVLGHVGRTPYLINPKLYPSWVFVGPSKKAGKSTIMQVLAAQAKRAVVWVDLTASRLDRAATRIREEGGKVFELILPDALDVLRNEDSNNNPTDKEVREKQLQLHVEYGKIAEGHVVELVEEWKKYGFPTRSVAFELKSGNTLGWLAYLDSFLNSLKRAMVDFYPQTGSDLLLVVDNWSHLANQQKDHPVLGSLPWDTAVNLARTINWFVTQGANAGIRIWIAIQNVDDFKKVIGDVVQSFNFLFKMGEGTGHLAKVINPQTGELVVTLNQHLHYPLLSFVERIKPKGEEDEETDS